MKRTFFYCISSIMLALFLQGCLIVSDGTEYDSCTDCYDYEVCQTWCDAWTCWDECHWETSCSYVCNDAPYYPDNGTVECYSTLDCEGDAICVNDYCHRPNTEERGVSGLCQVCETQQDCVEENARCISLNFDRVSRKGESICARDCEYNTDCPTGFECVNISDEPGVPAQCLPKKDSNNLRTCNAGADLECVRATDCAVGESCVNNVCNGPKDAECTSNTPCGAGKECRNFKCEAVGSPECLTRSDCGATEVCIDGECIKQNAACVFNAECDGGACVNGECVASCSKDADCGANERCRQNLCEVIECRRNADCAAGNLCVEAKCEQACEKDSHCSTGFVCNSYNYCQPDPNVECRSTAECARDEICTDGTCEAPCSCNQDCAVGEVCNLDQGLCEPAPANPGSQPISCEDTCGCPSGLSCTNGVCG